MLEDLLDQFRQGKRRALTRLLTHVVRGDQVQEIFAGINAPPHPSRIIALTGSAGVGKSSLTGKLLETIRADGQTAAVLACDPQSPISGGALLGDRFRMNLPPDDEGVFIRSLSTPGGLGGIIENLDDVVHLLRCFGFDVILIETVGAGQGDTRIHDFVDGVVLLLQPETGDDLQWEKAGVLEIADLVVIHKADLPGAENVEAQVLAMLGLSDRDAPPILRVSAKSGDGVKELWERIQALPLRLSAQRDGHSLLRRTQQELALRFEQAQAQNQEQFRSLLDRWDRGELATQEAVKLCCEILLSES